MLARLSGLMLVAALVAFGPGAGVGFAEEPAAEKAAAHDAGHGAGDAGHGGGHDHIGLADAGPNVEKPEEFKSDLALFTLVVFALLLLILRKFAWGPIISALEKREAMVANHIAEAERNHEEAKRLLAQHEQKLANTAQEIRELMDTARRDAENAKQTILAEAKAAAEGERNRALRDIESATENALQSLAERSAQLAVDLAGKIVKSQLSAADHSRLIEEAVAKFPVSSNN